MEEIGHILREARENKGQTHADVHEKLRITPKFLRAMEEGHFDALPSATHVRGYVRKYARHLGLDADPLLERYELHRHQKPVRAPEPQLPPPEKKEVKTLDLPPQPETGTFYNPINDLQGTEPQEDSDWVSRFIIVALVVFIGLLSWRFGPMVLGTADANVDNPFAAAVATILNEPTPTPDPVAAGDDPAVQTTEPLTRTELIVPTGRTTGGTSGASTAVDNSQQLPPPTPTRNPLPATINIINLQIDVTENRTWVRVTIDGTIAYEGLANKGDLLTYTAEDDVTIRTGDAAGLFVTINDIEIGRLGARGQVVDQTWETTQ